MVLHKWISLVASVVICELVGAIGSIFTAPSIPGWYSGLVRPALAPPNWVFGPVWTTLFALMGVSVWLVWQHVDAPEAVRAALYVFAAQFVFNILWSVLFFGLHSPGWAVVGVILLWLAIVATIVSFARVSYPAAWLLVPYLAWVTFAAYLNYQFYVLN